MKYKKIVAGRFVERPNRFIAYVEIHGKEEVCHVKNTGRCRELLTKGCRVYLEENDHPNRKTKYDLVAVEKGERLINMDSNAPNQVVKEWLSSPECILFREEKQIFIKPECKYGNSRFDFYIETEKRKIFMEVKGVTLEEQGVVKFPDAPSERAVKHIEELIMSLEEGYEAYVMFVVQMKGVTCFTPNGATHEKFCAVLKEAAKKGVNILAYDCQVTENSLKLDEPVRVCLDSPD
ncbi:MAG: DNA/RNA nuclease SfsA [Lachnospiraceae bacterium]|nr:DNA/RNA nuclease SfsA [Lachnospiraceae bacterium]